MNIEQLLQLGLLVAGFTHFGVLLAGMQAPAKLNWKEELPRMSAFNRKIMVVYYLFTGFTIVLFGSLTLYLRAEILDRDPVAAFLALVIGIWWSGRILVDMFVFDHDDWPEGKQFVIGHIVLTTGFVGMATVMLTAGIRGMWF
jgi:magnesium-transporting ATPase (P-type)